MDACVNLNDPKVKLLSKDLNVSVERLVTEIRSYRESVNNPDAYPDINYLRNYIFPWDLVVNDYYQYTYYVNLKRQLEEDGDLNTYDTVELANQAYDFIISTYGDIFGKALKIIPTADGKYQVAMGNIKSPKKEEDQKPVKSTITPTKELLNAIDKALDHIAKVFKGTKSQLIFTISGKAGTGKTTIAGEIARRAADLRNGYYLRVMSGALAHKATMVLGEKMRSFLKNTKVISDSKTLAGMLGMKVEYDSDGSEIWIQNPDIKSGKKHAPIESMDLLIIDEVSMLEEDKMDILKKAIKGKKIAVLFLGDVGQLPPIRSKELQKKYKVEADAPSPAFTDKDIEIVYLTERIRQGEDSPILGYADRYYEFGTDKTDEYPVDLSVNSVVNDNGALIILDNSVDLVEQLTPLFQQAKDTSNPNLIKIIAYRTSDKDTESTVTRYNRLIRKALRPDAEPGLYYPGDLIMFNDSYTKGEDVLYPNSWEGAVEKASGIMDLKDILTDATILDFIKDIKGWKDIKVQIITPYSLVNGLKVLGPAIPVIVGTKLNLSNYRNNLKLVADKINSFEKFRRGALWATVFYPLKGYMGNVQLAYAISSHKSQGSTYDIAVVDATDINDVKKTTRKTKAQSMYVAITRARNITIVSTSASTMNYTYTGNGIRSINNRLNKIRQGMKVSDSFSPERMDAYPKAKVTDDPKKYTPNSGESGTVTAGGKKGFKRSSESDDDYGNDIDIKNSDLDFSDAKEKSRKGFSRKGSPSDKKDKSEEDQPKERIIKSNTPKPGESRGFVRKNPVTPQEDNEGEEDLTPLEKAYNAFKTEQLKLNSIITFNKKDHIYNVNGINHDYSVTEFISFMQGKQFKENPYSAVALPIGNTHDALLRDFFMGMSEEDILKKDYPNLGTNGKQYLLNQAKRLKKELLDKYGKDAIFITDEKLLRVAANIQYKGNTYLVAGTMDMVVIDKKGNKYVVDFKTRRANGTLDKLGLSNEIPYSQRALEAQMELNIGDDNLEKYTGQISLYALMAGANLNIGEFEDEGAVAQFNVLYTSPYDVKYIKKDDQVYVEKEINGRKVIKRIELSRDTEGNPVFTPGFFKDLVPIEVNGYKEQLVITPIKTGLQKADEARKVARKTEVKQQPPIEVSSKSKKYGILSNFGDKPFVATVKVNTKEVEKEFPTVEHYYQYSKARIAGEYGLAEKMLKMDVNAVKRAGSYVVKLEGRRKEIWDRKRKDIMLEGMRLAFELNPDAAQLLLDTGNALLTHNIKNREGKYDDTFSTALMQIREELGGYGEPKENKTDTRLAENHKKRQELEETDKSEEGKEDKKKSSKIQLYKGKWSRNAAERDTKTLYIFTDNTDRDSGSKPIDNDSWYALKYGKGHHYPTMTQAVLRGLDNARPVSTQRWYHDGAKGKTGRWNDEDLEEFKKVIDDEFEEIINEWRTGKYSRIMFGDGDGLFNGKISEITMERTPQIYTYLESKYNELVEAVEQIEKSAEEKRQKNLRAATKHRTAEGPTSVTMNYVYNGEQRDDVSAVTTIDAIANGERTATTRYSTGKAFEYWQLIHEGDIVEMHDKEGRSLLVKITLAPRQLTESDSAEEWSKKEGWSILHFEDNVAERVKKGEAYQIEFEYVPDSFTGNVNVQQTNAEREAEAEAFLRKERQRKIAVTDIENRKLKPFESDFFHLEQKELASNPMFSGEFILTVTGEKMSEDDRIYIQTLAQSMPMSSQLTFDSENINYNTIDIMATLGAVESVYIYFDETNKAYVDPKSSLGLNLSEKTKKSKAIKYNSETGELLIPMFTIGYSYAEIKKRQELDTIMLSELFDPTVLRGLSKAAMYAVSDIISTIQQNKNGYQYLFKKSEESWKNDPNKDVDFTTLDRVDIIRKIGLSNLLTLVRDKYFNSETRDDDTPESTLEKLDLLYDNWEAFVELGYETLIGLEHVAMDTNGNAETVIKEEVDTEFDDKTLQEIQEMMGDSLESWQVGFRQVSAFSSLSLLIKQSLEAMFQYDANGNQIVNEFGIAERVKVQEATAKILKFTKGALTLEQMIQKLEAKVEDEPWLQQVLDSLGEADDPDKAQYRALFFSNFRKYFQKYGIVFKDNNGGIKVKIINENEGAAEALELCKTKEAQYLLGGFKLRTKEGIHQRNFQRLKELSRKIKAYLKLIDNSKGKKIKEALESQDGYSLEEYHNIFKEAFDLLDLELPADSELYRILDIKKNVKTLADKLKFLTENIEKDIDGYKPLNANRKEYARNITGYKEYKSIVDILAKNADAALESMSYEAGKMYYSYVNPNYLSRLVTKLSKEYMTDEEYDKFLNTEYLKYKWFFKDGKVRSRWLRKLKNSKEIRQNFVHIASLHQLDKGYQDKTPMEYASSMIRHYFYDANKKWAYYRIPMMSNKPSEEYLKFERISVNYKEEILNGFWDVFLQEIDRIMAVKERNATLRKDLKIKSFDTKGLKFVILSKIQPYYDGTYKDRYQYKNLTDEEKAQEDAFHEALVNKLDRNTDTSNIGELFHDIMERTMNEEYEVLLVKWREEGLITKESFKNEKTGETEQRDVIHLEGTKDGDRAINMNSLEEFFWNDAFAYTLIIELTITDPAYYKDAEDLQKRLALLHAPGMAPDITAVDANGNRYTAEGDAKERTVYIKDEELVSSIIENLITLKDLIIQEYKNNGYDTKKIEKQLNGIIEDFKNVNWTDAQGYSSITSYRKKMGIFGKWNPAMETAYNDISSGKQLTPEEFKLRIDILWQPLKPFVYTQISKDGHNSILPEIKMGVQNKNSEYLLIMADALLKRGSKANKLRVISEWMEESLTNEDSSGKRIPNGMGIDTVQFNSTVKTGETGVIDLTGDLTEQEILDRLNKAYTIDPKTKKRTYNQDYVHEIPFEDYVIQQEVPAHFRDHEQGHGSQVRILTWADVQDTITVNGQEVDNYIEVDCVSEADILKYGKRKKMKVKEAKEKYFNAIAKNIEMSVDRIIKEFKLDHPDRRIRNIQLSRMLKKEILRDGRFGSDMLWACDTNKYGEFNIPLSDPIHSSRVQMLLNSIIKNRVNKQEIAGGPVVQVTSWGLSEDLNIVFADALGNLLLTLSQWEQLNKGTAEDYRKYLKGKQARIAYFESYVPILDKHIVEDFMRLDDDGNMYIDTEAMYKANPKLLEMIGYRIPTESKYSMVPMRVKGFLPINAGEGVMLPMEITKLSGSDFDIDKLYIMRYTFDRIKDKNTGDVTYKLPEEGTKGYNDNLIIAMQMAVLTSSDTRVMKLIFTPGNFEEPKKYGYLISYVLKEYADKVAAGEEDVDIKEIYDDAISKLDSGEWDNNTLKSLSQASSNLMFNYVQMQFHKLNMTAGKLIGIFALANVSHAFLSLYPESALNIDESSEFRFDNIRVSSNSEFKIDRILSSDGETYISSSLAALLAASVDAVKDPILNLININTETANVVTSMLRMGFTMEQVALLCSQPVIKQVIKDYGISLASEYSRGIRRIVQDALDELDDETFDPSQIEVTTEALISNLNGRDEKINYMALMIFQKMLRIADAFGDITHITRYNSIASAVGPFATDTMLLRIKRDAFKSNDMITDETKAALLSNPLLRSFIGESNSLYGNSVNGNHRELNITGPDSLERILLGGNMIQAGDKFYSLLRQLGEILGRKRGVDDSTARRFSDFYMAYYTHTVPLESGYAGVFDLSYENRFKVLTKFPDLFLVLKNKYNNNLLVSSIRYDNQSSSEEYPVLKLSTRRLDNTAIEDLKKAWLELYNGDDESRRLALTLAEYNFFRGSFGFSPKTFIQLLPNAIKIGSDTEGLDLTASFKLYQYALNNRASILETNDDVIPKRLINQFILHYADELITTHINIDKKNFEEELFAEKVEDEEDSYVLDVSLLNVDEDADLKSMTKEERKEYKAKLRAKKELSKHNGLPFVWFKRDLYAFIKLDANTVKLVKVNPLGGRGQGFEIDPEVDYPTSVYSGVKKSESLTFDDTYQIRSQKKTDYSEKNKRTNEEEDDNRRSEDDDSEEDEMMLDKESAGILAALLLSDNAILKLGKGAYAPRMALKDIINKLLPSKGYEAKFKFGTANTLIMQEAVKKLKLTPDSSPEELRKVLNEANKTLDDLNVCGKL